MKLKIVPLEAGRLRLEEAYGFFSLVGAEFTKCTSPLFAPVYAAYAGSLSAFDEVLERAGGSHLMRSLGEADARRDAAYRGLAALVRASLHHFNPPVANAAREVEAILSRYANPTALPYIQENGVLLNLVQDLDTPAARALLALVGAVDWLDELKAGNEEFIALFSTRNEERAGVMAGEVREARLAVVQAYQDCITRLAALAEIEGVTAYAPVIATINRLVEYQKNVLATRRGRKGKAGEPENETEDPAPGM